MVVVSWIPSLLGEKELGDEEIVKLAESVNVFSAVRPDVSPVAAICNVELAASLGTCQVVEICPSATPSRSPEPPSVTDQPEYVAPSPLTTLRSIVSPTWKPVPVRMAISPGAKPVLFAVRVEGTSRASSCSKAQRRRQ